VTSAFAEAASKAAQPASTPQSNPLPFNKENLFGSPSENKGGGMFVPTPPYEALIGRTLVYVPRTFDENAKDPFDPDGVKTRKLWTCDLYVVDGGRLSFWYKQKADLQATPPRPAAQVEHVVEDVSPQTPFFVPGFWVAQAAIVPKISAVAEKRQWLVGTPVRGAQKAQQKDGATDESVRQEHQAWVDRGKQGPEPKFLWLIEDASSEGMARVHEWYGIHGDSIKL
jgi:hypothetical protein